MIPLGYCSTCDVRWDWDFQRTCWLCRRPGRRTFPEIITATTTNPLVQQLRRELYERVGLE